MGDALHATGPWCLRIVFFIFWDSKEVQGLEEQLIETRAEEPGDFCSNQPVDMSD